MAEAFGIAAGVIQFVDVCLRLYPKLNRFCSDIRDAPQIIRDLHVDLRQQLNLAQNIRINHGTIIQTATSADTVEIPLRHYVDQIKILDGLLDGLKNEENDRLWHRGWKGIRMAKRKDEILAVCGRLERQKSSLSMWLAETNLKVSAEMKSNLEQTSQSIQQNASVVQNIEETSSRNASAIELMHPRVDQLHRTSSKLLENTKLIIPQMNETHQMSASILSNTEAIILQSRRINSDLASTRLKEDQILPKVDQISADTQLLTREVQSMRDDWSRFYAFINSNPALKNTMDQVPDQTEPQVKVYRYQDSSTPWGDASRHFEFPDFEVESPGRLSPTRCTCRPKSQTSHWIPISMLQFRRSFRTQHCSYCPRYKVSDQSLELVVRFVPPPWLSARSINLSMWIRNWNASKGCSLSPMVIGTGRLVDTAKSPAFQAVLRTGRKIMRFRRGCDKFIEDLQTVLHNLYISQKASPFDEDHLGNTILREILCLYKLQCKQSLIAAPSDRFISLIQFVLHSGADPNVISIDKRSSWVEVEHFNGTALDIFADMLVDPHGQQSMAEKTCHAVIYKGLVGNGSEFSQPIRSIESTHPFLYCHNFLKEVSELRRFPEQIELHGHEHLVSAILQRSEEDFLHVARSADINHASSVNGLTALHFAIEWPRALEYLIDNGANINVEDHYKRRPIHLAVELGLSEAVNLLLKADCALATPLGGSLLERALELQHPEKDTIIDAVVEALIDRHGRLLSYTRAALTEQDISGLGIKGFVKLERRIPDIKTAILSHGLQLPEALELDDKGVFDTTGLHEFARLTPQIAEKLWQAGFKDIDSPGRNGMTPLLQSWCTANLEMISWLIQKGANEFSRTVDTGWSGLHLYAIRLAYPGPYCKWNLEEVSSDIQRIARLQKESSLGHDDCSCLCSLRGCTPVTILLKHSYDRPTREVLYQTWLVKTAPSPTLLEQYSYDCTRIVIFKTMMLNHTCCDSYLGSLPKHRTPQNKPHGSLKSSIEKEKLEAYMTTYETYRHTYSGPDWKLPFSFLDEHVLKGKGRA